MRIEISLEEMMKRWMVSSIAIIFIFFLFISFIKGDNQNLNAGDLYDLAMELFYTGKYEESIERFLRLIQTFPQSRLVPYAYYMIALTNLKMERYEEALKKFEFYIKTYSEGDRIKEAKRGLEICQERIKEISKIKKEDSIKKDLEAKKSDQNLEKIEVQEEYIKKEIISSKEIEGSIPEAKSSHETIKVKRRICAQVFYFDGKSLSEVEKRIRDLKKAGIDTIIFRVFQNKGDRIYRFIKPQQEAGVYFKTEHAPVVFDILGKIAEISHRNGMDIFAWMTTRYADFGLDVNPDYRCRNYNFETKRVEIARGYNLFHPEIISRLEGIYRDLGRYPIDGILFQDDLILRHNEDFSLEANKAFLKEYGFSPHPDNFYIEPYKSENGKYYVKGYTERFWIWANWKNRWLMDIAKRLISAAKDSNPNLQFGLNLYYETILNHSNAIAWFSQDLSRAKETNFDYYAIMAYHRQTMKELNIEEQKAIKLMVDVSQKAIQRIGNPSKVLMKIQILDWKAYEVVPEKEVREILSGILRQGDVSLAFVPYIHQFPLHLLKDKWSGSN